MATGRPRHVPVSRHLKRALRFSGKTKTKVSDLKSANQIARGKMLDALKPEDRAQLKTTLGLLSATSSTSPPTKKFGNGTKSVALPPCATRPLGRMPTVFFGPDGFAVRVKGNAVKIRDCPRNCTRRVRLEHCHWDTYAREGPAKLRPASQETCRGAHPVVCAEGVDTTDLSVAVGSLCTVCGRKPFRRHIEFRPRRRPDRRGYS